MPSTTPWEDISAVFVSRADGRCPPTCLAVRAPTVVLIRVGFVKAASWPATQASPPAPAFCHCQVGIIAAG
ncbi:hypothetical protein GCM10010320_68590 [Streptomyces caelestis]|nr:hypothetical protein GCM10010320_68590 [Streptomyces caelestis]